MNDRDAFRAVLHVDPVVAVIPDALNAKVVLSIQRVWQTSQRLNKETLRNVTLSRQYQHPRVNPQSKQTVFIGKFQ